KGVTVWWSLCRRPRPTPGGAAASRSTSPTGGLSSTSTCPTSAAPDRSSSPATGHAGSTPSRRSSTTSIHCKLLPESWCPSVLFLWEFGSIPLINELLNFHGISSFSSRREEVWSYTDFDHPATFETLAMNPAKKRMIMDDLDDFRDSRDYYRRIGKAWKRGYFLYGPPGTGKSSMVAAMANHLNYDVYDVELASLQTNSDLRKLFAETTRRSIIVIEDIDCSLDHAATEPQRDSGTVTLPGLLSFIDGLWSAHGGERIVVVTTNRTRALDDPALARRGRMDVHVEMSYCELGAFMTLAKNYLGVDAHPLFYAVEELLRVADMTPADVAECLMARSERTARRDADACLARLVDELRRKAAVGKTAVKEKLVLLPGKEKSEENQAAAKENGGEATADGTTS
uniref:AAA+ ATPase domain-containing protein n=2 Tax=Aegilops tauschii subsp. strangulata TaxID=200361 RepID=A0A453S2I6_AEGTS